jgi:DNA-binding GntR family transcriptional regulator
MEAARQVREALRVLEADAFAAGASMEALAFERLAANGSDDRLARLARMLR